MQTLISRALGSIALRTLAVTVFLSLLSPSIAPAHAIGTRARVVRPPLMVGTMPERNSVAYFRPRHVATSSLLTDRRGDTAPSSTYFKITNITAEVGGLTGSAAAVNNDGRIGYTDFGNQEDIPGTAYVVNNGGTFAQLYGPFDPGFDCEFSELTVTALNENAEAVGSWSCGNGPGFIGWLLSGANYSSISFYDQSGQESNAYAVNDHDVAVGCSGPCYTGATGSAIVVEKSGSTGRTIPLRGFKGAKCLTTATSINDAGSIVGSACDEAVRFSTSGYAQPLGLGRGSAAEAVNQHGDIVGSAGSSAFLERDGRTLRLPKPAPYGRDSAIAYAVNSTDEVVGTLYGPTGAVAFIYTGGHVYALDSLLPPHSGWQIADALGVNDHGEIVGDGYYNGTLYGIALKPPR
jgi:hypothetical protein